MIVIYCVFFIEIKSILDKLCHIKFMPVLIKVIVTDFKH